jgi:hypothetical protein
MGTAEHKGLGPFPVDVAEPAVVVAPEESPHVLPPTENLLQNWERTEITSHPRLVNTKILGADGPLITLTKTNGIQGNTFIDSSVRIPTESGSYILRHGRNNEVYAYDNHTNNDYADWELIKTIPESVSGGNNNAEKVVFKVAVTNPNLILDDTIAPEWRKVVETVRVMLSSLPDECPEKEILQNAWKPVSIANKTTAESLKQQQIMDREQERLIQKREYTKIFLESIESNPNIFQKITSKLSEPFKKWKKRTGYRHTSLHGSYHYRQYYFRSNAR